MSESMMKEVSHKQ